jgi:outer membrane lipoprotein-sorting protein
MIGHSLSTLEELPYIQTMHNKPLSPLCASAYILILALALSSESGPVFAQPPQGASQPSAGQGVMPSTSARTATAPGEAPAEPPTEAEKVIDLAIKKVAGLKSVAADLVQNVEMLKQRFDIKGRYLRAPSSRIYLKLNVSGLADSTGTMLQICDGETLWDYQQVLESQSYRRMSVKPVFERLNSPDIDAKLRDQVMTQIGFSGPEALLVGLRKSVKFDQKEEGELDGKHVWILRGTWRNRSGLVGPDQRPLPATGPLPAYVPSLATLYLGKDDGWPYKIILVGKVPTILQDTRRVGPDGRVTASKSSIEKVDPSKITLVYSNVLFNPNIRPDEFAFQAPPNANVEDTTETIIKGLDQAIQFQAMQKRTEAARQEGPILDTPIEIPKPPAAEPTPK